MTFNLLCLPQILYVPSTVNCAFFIISLLTLAREYSILCLSNNQLLVNLITSITFFFPVSLLTSVYLDYFLPFTSLDLDYGVLCLIS